MPKFRLGRTRKLPSAPSQRRFECWSSSVLSFLFALKWPVDILSGATILCQMKKAAVYLTDPEEMRKVRLNQPRVSSEQARRQRELFRRARAKFSEDAKKKISLRGRLGRAAN